MTLSSNINVPIVIIITTVTLIPLAAAILIPTTSIAFVMRFPRSILSPLRRSSPHTKAARTITTDTSDETATAATEPTEAQLLLWQRQIKLCGNNVTKGLHLLRHIQTTLNEHAIAMDDINSHLYEPLYLETLGVIGRAKRSNPKSMLLLLSTTITSSDPPTNLLGTICRDSDALDPIQQLAIQLYTECPTDACRSRTISICNTTPSHTKEQQENIQQIAIQLLHHGIQPPSISSYHATLAACAIAKDYRYTIQLLQHEIPLVAKVSTTTLSYNILFTALCRAEQGHLALDILHQMIHQQQPQQQMQSQAQSNSIDLVMHRNSDDGHTNLNNLPPPDLNTFHVTIKALIATPTSPSTTLSQNIDAAYSVLNTMMEFDDWYRYQTIVTTGASVRPNTVTFDLLINAYSRIGVWDKVKFIESIQSQYMNHYESQHADDHQSFVFPSLPSDQLINNGIASMTAKTEVSLKEALLEAPLSVSPSYFSSSIRLQWENVGMKKFKNEKYWMIGTYIDHIQGFNFIVALQPHRNPIKNGIKILLYKNHDTDDDGNNSTTATGATKVGYLLMINHPASHIDVPTSNEASCVTHGTSTLLGVYLDPLYRRGGLSKIIIAIWLQLCTKAQAIPRTGVMNKPLLALVLQHTFHFVPEVTTGNNGVNVEVSLVTNSTVDAVSPSGSAASPSTIGIYSSNIKCLQGVFSLRDIRRENIQLLREPASPNRGRSCQIGATFVLSNVTTTRFEEMIEQQLLGKSQGGKLVYSTNNLSWENVFFGYNEPQ